MSHFRPKEVLHRAQTSEQEGQQREAAKDYASLSVYFRKKNKLADALKMISKAIALNPDSGRLYLEEAACAYALEDETRSAESIQKCIQIGIEKKQLQLYYGHLSKHFQDCSFLKIKFFESWLVLDRTSATPFLGLGEELLATKQWEQAKQLFINGLRVEPDHSVILTKLESLLQDHGNETERDYCKRFREKSLSYEDFVLLLGAPASRKAERQDSLQSQEKSSELKGLGELVSELEKELELDGDEEYENVEPVIQEFLRKSNQVIGSDLQARLDLAFAFLEMGRLREAKLELNYIEPEHVLFGQSQHLLGNILLKEGSDVAALGAFQSALRTSVKGTSFWKETIYQLIKINLKLGDQLNAKKLMDQLEKVDSQYRDLKNLKQSLKLEPK